MQRDVIDGVTVLWTQAPGPLEAALVFGCGLSDESFRHLGVTHLVEHLAMSTLPRLHHEHNASVTLSLTEFTASGSPAQVTEFLVRVCEALSALPLDRMEREAGVLAAEGAGVIDPTGAELLSFRYGTVGAGLASWDGPGPDRIPAQAVRDIAARYFHADNAVLVLTGPPPAGLRLPLPRGPRPGRGTAQPVRKAGPAWFPAEVPGPGLAFHGDTDDPALVLAHAVLQERLRQRARHQEGLSYEVDGARVPTGAGQGEYLLCLDAREGQEQRVAELLWEETLRMAGAGVTEEELAEELAGFREVWLDPRSVPSELGEAAACLLFGLEYRDARTRLDALAKVTPEQAGRAFTGALDTVLLVVPSEVEVELRRLDGASLAQDPCSATRAFPSDVRVFKPSLANRIISSEARAARLGVGPSGLWCRDAGHDVHHVPFDEVVGVEVRGAGRVVFGSCGCLVPVVPELWAKIGPAVAAIDAAVPEALRYETSGLLADRDD
ncbi:insulinase family protein [Streptomyces pactum]|uniref:Insulinase family protein n=1 Tax=Streptomyces pactum TaxID=68249 RepID=A0ABS0NHS7_9ACTN|nr:insulinase family protein [Streptomyces pactum]MBH5334739.1 insulinase family protein [Streptomyces pactum]